MKKFLFALLVFVFTLPALAENTILIIGDSLSAGYGIDPKQGWAALLQKRLHDEKYNYTVVNASISGDTTSNGLTRMPAALNQYEPQITIIELGGNDGLRGLPLVTLKNNLQQLVELAKNADSKVLLVAERMPPNYGPSYTQQFQQVYVDVASAESVGLVPLFLKGIDDRSELMQEDGIHPKIEAQAMMLNNVWPELVKLLH